MQVCTAAGVEEAIAEFFYGCNVPPAIVGHPLFNKLVSVVKTAARRARRMTGYR